jgi:hypothetical protein
MDELYCAWYGCTDVADHMVNLPDDPPEPLCHYHLRQMGTDEPGGRRCVT